MSGNDLIFRGVIIYLFLCIPIFVYSENIITIDCGKNIGRKNEKILGSNLLGYNPGFIDNRKRDSFGHADFGAGCWDSEKNKSVQAVIQFLKQSGIKSLRFPGGCGSHTYDWKQTIGKKREHFLFGLDEFLQVCKEVEAEPVITLSYYTGTPEDAADMAEYLNFPADAIHPWALKRSENGHPEPYRVKYFEVGNEIEHGNHRDIEKVEPEEYAKKYLEFYHALKKRDPFVQVGVVLNKPGWNQKVAEIIKDNVDFGIVHTYPSPAWGKKLEKIPAQEIFEVSFAMAMVRDDFTFKDIQNLFMETGGIKLPLAVTEFNGGYAQAKPVPYRFTLGCALVNAELLRVFMIPENNVFMANHWNFCNEYWGSIANGFRGNTADLHNTYYKRPNYYVFEMYHQHFGKVLLETEVKSENYIISRYDCYKKLINANLKGVVLGENRLSGKWTIKDFSGVETSEEVMDSPVKPGNDSHLKMDSSGKSANDDKVLKIDFRKPRTNNYFHSFQEASVEPDTFYKFSGFIKIVNFSSEKGINLEVQDSRGWRATRSAAGTKPISGTRDWTYTEAVYLTLPDAHSVRVIVRSVGDKQPIHGTVYFRGVKLVKFLPLIDGQIPYLSVNASKSEEGKNFYMMVLNKNLKEPHTASIRLKNFNPASSANVFTLNGPEVISTNEQNHENVRITSKTIQVPGANFDFTFDPHSLTAIEIQAVE